MASVLNKGAKLRNYDDLLAIWMDHEIQLYGPSVMVDGTPTLASPHFIRGDDFRRLTAIAAMGDNNDVRDAMKIVFERYEKARGTVVGVQDGKSLLHAVAKHTRKEK